MLDADLPDHFICLGLGEETGIIREERGEQHIDGERLHIVGDDLVEKNAVPRDADHLPDELLPFVDRKEVEHVDGVHPVDGAVLDAGQVGDIAHLEVDLVLEPGVAVLSLGELEGMDDSGRSPLR